MTVVMVMVVVVVVAVVMVVVVVVVVVVDLCFVDPSSPRPLQERFFERVGDTKPAER